MRFLKVFLAALSALVVFSGLVFLLILGIVSAIGSEQKVEVKQGAVLHLRLNQPIGEIEFENELEGLGIFSSSASQAGLVQIKQALKHAASDNKISGVHIDLNILMAGLGTAKELRDALVTFKESGKFITSYSEYYSEGAYYLASVGDEVWLNPQGEVEFNGLTATITFYKGLFDKLGIEPQIFRVGAYKSAVEPYVQTSMSDENRLQMNELLSSMHEVMLNDISASRNVPANELKEIANAYKARNAETCLEYGLIDSLVYEDQALEKLAELASTDEVQLISYSDYNKSYSNYSDVSDKIAVIIATGEIVMGDGGDGMMGADALIKEIRKAREDEGVKAVVIRINSPGGGYIATEMIWREVKLTAEKKPVVASMSDLATSGGYYIAAAADEIVAQPTTITGSIGIFAMIFSFEEFLEDKLGITNDVVNTGKYSNLYRSSKSLNEQEKSIIQAEIEQNYNVFLERVAEGRGMERSEVEPLASGRVWSATKALEIDLVDELGALEVALQRAASLAELDTFSVRYFPEKRSLLQELFKEAEEENTKALREELGTLYPYYQNLKALENDHGILVKWPYDLKIN